MARPTRPAWFLPWVTGELTEERTNGFRRFLLAEWPGGIPQAVRDAMLKCPPGCVVSTNAAVKIEGLPPGRLAIVRSYLEKGALRVALEPTAKEELVAWADWFDVVGYYRGQTVAWVEDVLKEIP